MKIRPVGAQLSHVDGRSDRLGEANNPFPKFCKRAWKKFVRWVKNFHNPLVYSELQKESNFMVAHN
jgi:hypothetical protein